MPLPMQASLLRVLQEREVTRLGENQPRAVDVRLIAATHRDLERAVREGSFRADLLYRLREVTLPLPPLAQRGDDVLLLARLFLGQAEELLSLRRHGIGADAERALRAHSWPGNVRELRATMRRAAVLCDGAVIAATDLDLGAAPAGAPGDGGGLGDLGRPLDDARDDFTRRYVEAVLAHHRGNREAAAAALGISVRSLYRHLGAG
jgi:DNA-binding NtrC family response regulator